MLFHEGVSPDEARERLDRRHAEWCIRAGLVDGLLPDGPVVTMPYQDEELLAAQEWARARLDRGEDPLTILGGTRGPVEPTTEEDVDDAADIPEPLIPLEADQQALWERLWGLPGAAEWHPPTDRMVLTRLVVLATRPGLDDEPGMLRELHELEDRFGLSDVRRWLPLGRPGGRYSTEAP